MADNDELIQQFITVSGVDTERAKFYLQAAGWDLSVAFSNLYEDTDEVSAEGDADASAASSADKKETSPKKTPASASSGRLNIFCDDNSSDEDEGQAFYAGGSEHSGQQVLGPSKKKDIVSRLFKSAREHGAEVVEGGSDKPKKRFFGGTGYRLGETENDTQVIHPTERKAKPQRDVILKMWKTGFSVDDGPLRDYLDPANADFLRSINRSEIPTELLKETRRGEVYINLEDHRHEEFEAAKKSLAAFSGSGHMLGSIAPTIVGQVLNTGTAGGASGSTAIDKPSDEEKAKETLNLKPSEPTTNVQVKLTDGSRLVIRLNHTHTVGNLRQYVQTARPNYSLPFAIMNTFPHAELADDNQTLKDAKLLNATVVIKMK